MINLPKGWEKTALVNVSELIFGQSPPSVTYNNQKKGFPFFQGKADFGIIYPVVKVWCIQPKKYAQAGDILLSIRAPVGSTNIAQSNCAIGRGLAAVRPQTVVSEFIHFYLKFIETELSSKGTGTIFKAITKAVLQNQIVPIAPLNEQKRIVSKIEELFSKLDEAEAALKRTQKLLSTYRQSILKAAVTGELTKDWREENKNCLGSGKEFLDCILAKRRDMWKNKGKYQETAVPSDLYMPILPDSWAVATIDQICSSIEYGSSAKCTSACNGIPVIRMGNIFQGQLIFNKLKYLPRDHSEFPKLLLRSGDILFNRTNSAELVGKTAVFNGKPELCLFASYLIRCRPIQVEPEFISAFINSKYGKDWIKRVVSQQVGQANVNGTKLKMLSIPLPPENEQNEIINRLENIFSRISLLENYCKSELVRNRILRESILNAAFSGKLVPQKDNDEPASVLLERIRQEREKNRAEKPKVAKRKIIRKEKEPYEQEQY